MGKLTVLALIALGLIVFEFINYRYHKYRYQKVLHKQKEIAHMYQDINRILAKNNIVKDEEVK